MYFEIVFNTVETTQLVIQGFLKKQKQLLLPAALFLFLFACASSSFFISYPEQMATLKRGFVLGDAEKSIETLAKKGRGPNSTLNFLESGRISQLAHSYEFSKTQFEKAIDAFREEEDKARITATGSAALISSFVINDNALPYNAPAYEKIFAYHFQSFNYLAAKDIQGAMVEIRRANEEQVIALENHHKELVKAQEQAEKENVRINESDFDSSLEVLHQAAGKVKNSFQNAYTFYYSALVRESSGDINGAYIDYKKALEIFPDNRYVRNDTVRLAQRLSMHSDLESFRRQFGKDFPNVKTSAGNGSLIIFYEHGLAPEKSEIFLPLSTYHSIHSIAFPTYLQSWQGNTSLRIRTNTIFQGETDSIIDVHALAAKALQEKTFSQLLRQMIRVNAKARLQREARGGSDMMNLGGFVAAGYSMISERADLRSWLTLPNSVDIARFDLPEGSHNIQLSNATVSEQIDVSIHQNKTILLRVVNPGNQKVYIEVFEL